MEERVPYRSRAVVAGLAALAVAAFLFVQDLIGAASSTLVGFSLDDVASGYFGFMWQQVVGFGLLLVLAFAGGVFLSLWLLAPATPALTVRQALLRGLLAAGIGAGVVLVVSFGLGMIGPMSGAGSLFGNAFPWPGLGSTVQAATMAFQTGIGALVRQAPVVMLVVVLAWLWLQKHPSQHADPADTAEV